MINMGNYHNKPFTLIGNPMPQAVNPEQKFSSIRRFADEKISSIEVDL